MSDPLAEARERMIAKRFGGNAMGAKAGGAGSKKVKASGPANKSGGDDKRISTVFKKMQMTPLNGVEEVNIFKNDGKFIT
jgi:hypothetical protein